MMKLVRTCFACPEQYDVYDGNEIVGYIRLRWSRFSVSCPDVGGEIVLDQTVDDEGMSGIFADEERYEFLQRAVNAIEKWRNKKEPTEDVEFDWDQGS